MLRGTQEQFVLQRALNDLVAHQGYKYRVERQHLEGGERFLHHSVREILSRQNTITATNAIRGDVTARIKDPRCDLPSYAIPNGQRRMMFSAGAKVRNMSLLTECVTDIHFEIKKPGATESIIRVEPQLFSHCLFKRKGPPTRFH